MIYIQFDLFCFRLHVFTESKSHKSRLDFTMSLVLSLFKLKERANKV